MENNTNTNNEIAEQIASMIIGDNDYVQRNPFELVRFNGMSADGRVARFGDVNWHNDSWVEELIAAHKENVDLLVKMRDDEVNQVTQKQKRIEQLEAMHQKHIDQLKHVVRVINEFLPDYEEDDNIIDAFSSLFDMYFGWDVGEVVDPRHHELEVDVDVTIKKRVTMRIKAARRISNDEIESHIVDVFNDDPDANHLCFDDSIFEVVNMHTDSEDTEDVDVTIL